MVCQAFATVRRGPPGAARRGYMLIETMIGAAVLAAALATSMTFIGDARYETGAASNRAQASSLAMAAADALVGMPHSLT
jgi:hypothetical protein